jgi:sugar/nucleoside kinase (ribokinase family)
VNIIVLTPVRLLGDGLAACFSCRPDMRAVAVVNDLASLRDTLATTETQVVLIDVTQGIDLFDGVYQKSVVTPPRVQALDTVGAGDCFSGDFAAALSLGESRTDLKGALCFAVAAIIFRK